MLERLKEYEMSTIYVYRELVDYLKVKRNLKLKDSGKVPKVKQDESYAPYNRPVNTNVKTEVGQYIPEKFFQTYSIFVSTMLNDPTKSEQDLDSLVKNKLSIKIYGVRFQFADIINKLREKFGVLEQEDFFLQKFSDKFGGIYYSGENTILMDVTKKGDISYLFHELMHMASCNRNNPKDMKHGFKYGKDNKEYFGNGIDEGYTNYLCWKKFRNYGFFERKGINIDISKMLERIVGEREMESMYLQSRPDSLAQTLADYFPTDGMGMTATAEVVDFIKKLDRFPQREPIQVKQARTDDLIYVPLKMYVTKLAQEYGGLYNIRDGMIDEFLGLCQDEYSNGVEKVIVNKKKLKDEVFAELSHYFPPVSYQMTA